MTTGNVEVMESPVVTGTGLNTWTLDASHTNAGFVVKHMMISNVRGEFSDVSGTLNFDANDLASSSVNVTIKTASIATKDANRDVHLKSADFFDVENYPELTFHSTEFAARGEGEFDVKGDLTIRGVKKEVVLHVQGPSEELKDPWGGTRIAFSAKTKVNRKDFGLLWNVALETGGILVGETVTITIDAEFVKQ